MERDFNGFPLSNKLFEKKICRGYIHSRAARRGNNKKLARITPSCDCSLTREELKNRIYATYS